MARDPGRTAVFADETGAVDHVLLEDLDAGTVAESAWTIVATTPESLDPVATRLLDLGAREMLLEKPGAMSAGALRGLADRAEEVGALVRIATNRRYFGSVVALRAILDDEAPLCARFDFTEWADRVATSGRRADVLERWALANSIHVIDTVEHLLGPLRPDHVTVGDPGALTWHPAGATFVGSGRCTAVPVTWSSSWIAPGRWSIEVRTRQGRYRLAPMERLFVMRPGTVAWTEIPPTDSLDTDWKPGVWRTVEAFDGLRERPTSPSVLPQLRTFAETLAIIETIAGYAS
ncbi:MAG: hypothetical protein CMJ83_02745 [Planctomycetes bacterium]|nr:hypothetical protein [Planctomycetota bacterium]